MKAAHGSGYGTAAFRVAELHWYEAHGIGKKEFKRKRCGDRGRARSVAETVRPVGGRTAVLAGTGAVVVGRAPLGDSQLTTFIGDVVFARPMAYQVSRTVLEMILSLKEKGGTTTWWPP